jgi:hypothetical protein
MSSGDMFLMCIRAKVKSFASSTIDWVIVCLSSQYVSVLCIDWYAMDVDLSRRYPNRDTTIHLCPLPAQSFMGGFVCGKLRAIGAGSRHFTVPDKAIVNVTYEITLSARQLVLVAQAFGEKRTQSVLAD